MGWIWPKWPAGLGAVVGRGLEWASPPWVSSERARSATRPPERELRRRRTPVPAGEERAGGGARGRGWGGGVRGGGGGGGGGGGSGAGGGAAAELPWSESMAWGSWRPRCVAGLRLR